MPDVSDVPPVDDTPAPPEEPPANDVAVAPEVEDETPRKRQRLDKTAKEAPVAEPQVDDIDSADENDAPTLEEQVSDMSL